jgi:hypothetical protein
VTTRPWQPICAQCPDVSSPIDEIYVTKGQYQKKVMAMGRGFSGRVQKRFCHVKVSQDHLHATCCPNPSMMRPPAQIVLREAPEKVRHRTRYVEPIMMRTLKHRGSVSSSDDH